VLLNEATGKPGPTFCPDCGRFVVPHNPSPQMSPKPPPTKQEYEANPPTTNPSDTGAPGAPTAPAAAARDRQ